MKYDTDALRDIKRRLEAGETGSALGTELCDILFERLPEVFHTRQERYEGNPVYLIGPDAEVFNRGNELLTSLDAVKVLRKQVLPGWRILNVIEAWNDPAHKFGFTLESEDGQRVLEFAPTMAASWLCAIISALIEADSHRK